MKRIVVGVCVAVLGLWMSVFAADAKLLEMRNKILDESKDLKSLLTSSQDAILISSLWDSCLMTVSQLDAYFSMVGIFNTIKKEDVSQEALSYLSTWLSEIKRNNDVNIKSLNSVTTTFEPKTKVKAAIMKNYFADLNSQIGVELNRLSLFKKSIVPKRRK